MDGIEQKMRCESCKHKRKTTMTSRGPLCAKCIGTIVYDALEFISILSTLPHKEPRHDE